MTRPLLYVQDILPQLDPDLLADVSVDTKIQAGIDRLLSMQTPSGGFGIWPGDTNPVLWGTAYVVHLMLDAKDKGFKVPQGALDRAVKWLDRNAENRSGGPKFRGTHPGYVQYVLSKAGKPHQAVVKTLLNGMKGSLDGPQREGRMLLQAALQVAGDRRYEKDLRKPDVSDVDGSRRNGWSYYSDLRRRGMTLTVFHELFGSDNDGTALADLVARKLKGQEPRSFNTQELMWGVSGLGRWVGSNQSVPAAGVKMNGDWVSQAADRKGKSGMAWHLAGASQAESIEIDLGNPPKHAVALVITTEGLPTNPVPADSGDQGMAITRVYKTADGNTVRPDDVNLGELVYVHLTLQSKRRETINHVALVDRIPAGWEIENPRLGRGSLPSWAPRDRWTLDYLDVKDDRYMAFGALDPNRRADVVYAVRATSEGQFALPGAHAEAMYDPTLWSRRADIGRAVVKGSSPVATR